MGKPGDIEDVKKMIAAGDLSEGRLLDSKVGFDPQQEHEFWSDLAADIVAMANTPRPNQEKAYIVLGMKDLHNGTLEACGLQAGLDENEVRGKLQERFSLCTPDYFRATVDYSYVPFHIGGKLFGAFEIGPQKHGPFYAVVHRHGRHDILVDKDLRWRVGTSNLPVVDERDKAAVYGWFGGVSPRSQGHAPPVSHPIGRDKEIAALKQLLDPRHGRDNGPGGRSHSVAIYGPPGVGKSTLARVLYYDAEMVGIL